MKAGDLAITLHCNNYHRCSLMWRDEITSTWVVNVLDAEDRILVAVDRHESHLQLLRTAEAQQKFQAVPNPLAAENERLKKALEYIVVCHEMVASERARYIAVSGSVDGAKELLAELAALEKEEVKDG